MCHKAIHKNDSTISDSYLPTYFCFKCARCPKSSDLENNFLSTIYSPCHRLQPSSHPTVLPPSGSQPQASGLQFQCVWVLSDISTLRTLAFSVWNIISISSLQLINLVVFQDFSLVTFDQVLGRISVNAHIRLREIVCFSLFSHY